MMDSGRGSSSGRNPADSDKVMIKLTMYLL